MRKVAYSLIGGIDIMECPVCKETMTTARNKDCEFDDGNNDILVTLYLTWCPECKHISHVDVG